MSYLSGIGINPTPREHMILGTKLRIVRLFEEIDMGYLR